MKSEFEFINKSVMTLLKVVLLLLLLFTTYSNESSYSILLYIKVINST